MRTCRSGLPPATQAAVACDMAAAQPALTMPHSAPVSSAEPLADRVHHLVEVRVLLVRRALRRAHLRQLDRAADDRQRAAAVDQRPDADGLVDVRLDRCRQPPRRASPDRAAALGAGTTEPAPNRPAQAEQVAAVEGLEP